MWNLLFDWSEALSMGTDIVAYLVMALLIEQLPDLVSKQVKAIQNLKIDKITVWDSGANGSGAGGSTSGFLPGMIGSLPPIHELAQQAGIDLLEVLSKVSDFQEALDEDESATDATDEDAQA
jgi:flotillin